MSHLIYELRSDERLLLVFRIGALFFDRFARMLARCYQSSAAAFSSDPGEEVGVWGTPTLPRGICCDLAFRSC